MLIRQLAWLSLRRWQDPVVETGGCRLYQSRKTRQVSTLRPASARPIIPKVMGSDRCGPVRPFRLRWWPMAGRWVCGFEAFDTIN